MYYVLVIGYSFFVMVFIVLSLGTTIRCLMKSVITIQEWLSRPSM